MLGLIDVNFLASLRTSLHGLPVTPLRIAVEYDNIAVVKWLSRGKRQQQRSRMEYEIR